MTLIRLSRGLVFFLFGFLLACGNKEDVKPLPGISALSRTEGYAGVKLKIAGSNFDGDVLANNIVKFGTAQAKVDSISKTELIVTVPVTGSTGTVTVATLGGIATGPVFRYYDVFVLGMVQSGGKDAIGIWKNGALNVITVAGKDVSPTAFHLEGDDIYVSGIITDGGDMPAYWVNKVLQTFDTPPVSGGTTDITVANGSVYVSGYANDGTSQKPVYWKDGVTNNLSDAQYDNEKATSIFIESGVVYVSGFQVKSDLTKIGTYWVDGAPNLLEDGSNETYGNQLVVDQGDVYVMGSSNGVLVNWVNGTIANVEGGDASAGSVIQLIGGEVVMGGYESTYCCGLIGTIWVKGVKNNLFNVGDTRVLSLAALNDDAFLAGVYHVSSTGENIPFYVFNDKLIQVTDGKLDDAIDFIAR